MTSRVVICPDKFKGSLTAEQAADTITSGWKQQRPHDELLVIPMADGGDGTVDVVAAATPGAERIAVDTVDALGQPHRSTYLLDGATAVIELAAVCGIARLTTLEPGRSHTLGLGKVMRQAISNGAQRLVVGVGGSASTDAGIGALVGLGATVRTSDGSPPLGGDSLHRITSVDLSTAILPPPAGVTVMVDVDAQLYGSAGAAVRFARQKGATDEQTGELDTGLRWIAAVMSGAPLEAGAGAAGGTAYGLARWGAQLAPGASAIAQLVGLPGAIATADAVITGEGSFDSTSLQGKTAGYVLATAKLTPTFVIGGSIDPRLANPTTISLSDLAGSTSSALAEPARWLHLAATLLADRWTAANAL